MRLFGKVIDEISRIHLDQVEDRQYCPYCRYDQQIPSSTDRFMCITETPTNCPAVKAEITALEAGIWGITELKDKGWLKDEI